MSPNRHWATQIIVGRRSPLLPHHELANSRSQQKQVSSIVTIRSEAQWILSQQSTHLHNFSEYQLVDLAGEKLTKECQRGWFIREQKAPRTFILFRVDRPVADVPVDFGVGHVELIGELSNRQVAGFVARPGFFRIAKDASFEADLLNRADRDLAS